jgi:MFS family permease
MTRSIPAVLLGTFVLRLSTGLTGALLLIYLARLPDFGEPRVSGQVAGIMAATYFAAELLLSPVFGVLSDRIGVRPIMQLGPALGAGAVAVTALTANLPLLAGTRWLEGTAAAASIPSVLSFIALATAGSEALRGRTVARFEAATVAGLGLGAVAAGPMWDLLGRSAFFVNAGLYLVSLLLFRFGVADQPADEAAAPDDDRAAPRESGGLTHYLRLLSGPILALAPTWIALNAVVGAWTTQSIFQLTRDRSPEFDDQMLMGGFSATQVSIGLAVALAVFFAGLFYWGTTFRRLRRTTIIGVGIAGGMGMVAAAFALNHSAAWGVAVQLALAAGGAAGLFVMAGSTPAALGLLADISEHRPLDRGAIMGLYSVFLGVGQIIGSLVSGSAADWLGIDGLLLASVGLLVVALLPLARLRADEHHFSPMPSAGVAATAGDLR